MEDKTWFFFKFGSEHHQGPFHHEEIVAMCKEGTISKNDVFWKMGMSRWRPLKYLPELSSLLPSEYYPDEPHEPPPISNIPLERPIDKKVIPEIEETEIPIVEETPEPSPEPEEAKTKPKPEVLLHPSPLPTYPRQVLWGGCVGTLFLSALLIYLALPSKKTISPYGIPSTERRRLAKLVGLTPSSSPRFYMVAEKSGESIWVSTDYPRPGVLFLELTSYPKKVLSTRKIFISSKAQLHGGYARFTEFNLKRGNWPTPGKYLAKISLYPFDSPSSLKNTTWEGTFTFAPKGTKRLSDDLKNWKRYVKTSYIDPLEDQFQRYQTFKSQLNRTNDLYQISNKERKAKIVFERRYNREVGPLLHHLILDAQKQHLSLLNTNKEASFKYKKIVEYGNDIGQLALNMIEQLNKGSAQESISRQVAQLRRKVDLALEAINIRLKKYAE